MEWDKSASLLLEKVPPFVQKTVREKVETLARERGKTLITESEVMAAREAFMGRPQHTAAPVQHAAAKKPVDNEKLSILKNTQNILIKTGIPCCTR